MQPAYQRIALRLLHHGFLLECIAIQGQEDAGRMGFGSHQEVALPAHHRRYQVTK
jgi:hypothetical protein